MSPWNRRALCQAGLYALSSVWLVGCAQPQRRSAHTPSTGPWSGRIHLRVDDPDAPRSFAAHFDLSTPLGTLLARLQWSVGEASIETAQERRSAATLSALLREVTGEALPIDALFDWLSGVPTLAGGWQADLQQLDEGRLSATRTQPPPAAMLRILLNP